jgi:hypothetical protein
MREEAAMDLRYFLFRGKPMKRDDETRTARATWKTLDESTRAKLRAQARERYPILRHLPDASSTLREMCYRLMTQRPEYSNDTPLFHQEAVFEDGHERPPRSERQPAA